MALLPNNLPYLLIVDDEATNHHLMDSMFDADYCIHHAYNGYEALEFIARHDYDVLLIDVLMPQMSGLTLLRHIRETAETADLPVILMSALMDSSQIAEGLKAGANDYITKPLDVTIVRARVRAQVKLKKLSDERKRTIEQLQQLHELRGHLFRIASHDLKNPLSNLRLAYQELRYMMQPAQQQDAETIHSIIDMSLNDMQTMIDDFMDAAALQNGKLRVNLDCVDARDSLLYVLNQFQPGAERKQIKLELRPDSMLIMADSQRLAQIIGNLVSNAIKYSPAGATVKLWTEQHNHCGRICIGDEGPGIPRHERRLLFQEFSKLTPRPTGGETSTGLGLWIVKELTHLLKGEVGADFPESGGSIFWVEFPLCNLESSFSNNGQTA